VNFYLSDRLRRATRRARAFFVFRRDPELRARLTRELATLRHDVSSFDQTLSPPSMVGGA